MIRPQAAGQARPDTLFIACSALGKEVNAIINKYGWRADFIPLDSRYHLYPMKIEEAVEKCLNDTDGDGYRRRVVVYGHCGAQNLDAILACHAGAVRPVGPHCYEMYGGQDLRKAIKEVPGTYVLTDYLVQAWDKLIVRGLKLDRYPKLTRVMFAHYKRMIYYAQEESDALVAKARAIANSLGLELVVRPVGYGDLEPRLVAIMEGRPQPGADAEAADYVYPTATGPVRL
ncbi:MAG: DUF1638 domain-containing protein [Betaproteobacteria bacterium]|nr:DUF1638 domain-containing protein [Betaproteobacteria bacterium]